MEINVSIKMVAFDLVGTLVKGELFRDARNNLRFDVNQGWQEAQNASGFNVSFDYQAAFQTWLSMMLPVKLHEQFRDYLVKHVPDKEYLYDDVSTLGDLKKKGIILGFVTDGSNDIERKMIEKILQHCGIEPSDCIIVTGEDVKGDKESLKPFHRLIEIAAAQGISHAEIIFVGDHPDKDYGCAQKAELIPRLICREKRCDFEIMSLDELLKNI